jgi:hypothetical protein
MPTYQTATVAWLEEKRSSQPTGTDRSTITGAGRFRTELERVSLAVEGRTYARLG